MGLPALLAHPASSSSSSSNSNEDDDDQFWHNATVTVLGGMMDGDIDRDIIEYGYGANLGDDVVVTAASSANGSDSGNTSDSASTEAPEPTHCGVCDAHLGGAAGHDWPTAT